MAGVLQEPNTADVRPSHGKLSREANLAGTGDVQVVIFDLGGWRPPEIQNRNRHDRTQGVSLLQHCRNLGSHDDT